MPFSLLVISPAGLLETEHLILPELFAAGLETLHVRKPGWSVAEIERYVLGVPEQYRARLVLHAHYELALRYPLKGIHLPEKSRRTPATGRWLRQLSGRSISASFHSLSDVARHRRRYDYVFLSPIFDSTSKAGYQSNFHLPEVQRALATWQQRAGYRPRVIALGGITPATLGPAQRAGFSGAAVLGVIWQHPDPVAAFRELRSEIR